MLKDRKLYSITRNLGLPEIDLFTTMAQILEIRRYRIQNQNPEFLKTYDRVVESLLSRSNLEELALVGDDNRNGRFSIRIMMGLEPVQFNVWAYPDRVQPERSKLPGDLLRWKGRKLTRRARNSYYKALGLLDSILANGGLLAVSPESKV